MKTPYGEIPERFVKDMSAQEMHDYLQKRYSRRGVLKSAAAMSTLAAAGPVFWRRSYADASTTASPTGPQWIALGSDPATEGATVDRLHLAVDDRFTELGIKQAS